MTRRSLGATPSNPCESHEGVAAKEAVRDGEVAPSDQLSIFDEPSIASQSSSSVQSGRSPDGNRQGGEGEGSGDGRVKPLPRTQLTELPGTQFEDMFGDPGRTRIGRYHHDGHDTEIAAAVRVAPRAGTQREKVLAALREHSDVGVTDYELWALYDIGARPHVPATRREELIADGWPIVDSGERRRTDTGSPAIVWKLVEVEPPQDRMFTCPPGSVDESAGMREGV